MNLKKFRLTCVVAVSVAIVVSWIWTATYGVECLRENYSSRLRNAILDEFPDYRPGSIDWSDDWFDELDTKGLVSNAWAPAPFVITFVSNEMHQTPGLTSGIRNRKICLFFFGYIVDVM